jgi:glycosyltransferase involved in cell wall biosynthesis
VIGVLCTSYPRGPDDPSGSFVRARARALVAAGQSVEVIAAGAGSEGSEGNVRVFRVPAAGAAEIFYAGGAPEALESGLPGQRACAWLEAAHFSARMMALAAQRVVGWSGVESHWLVPSALVACAVAPHLHHRAHAHGGDVFLLARLPGGATLARFLCHSGADLVFASADLRERFAHLCGDPPEALGARVSVQPAPYDSLLFRPRPAGERHSLRTRLGLTRFAVLAAGRLVPIKGFDVLVLAVGHLPAGVRPTLVIAGTGPEQPRLRRLAAACAVDLRLAGLLSPATLADWMTAADLFVHPCRSLPNRRSEGAPVVVREALAAGMSVVASAAGGLPELADHERLTLVAPENPSALAAQIGLAIHATTLQQCHLRERGTLEAEGKHDEPDGL